MPALLRPILFCSRPVALRFICTFWPLPWLDSGVDLRAVIEFPFDGVTDLRAIMVEQLSCQRSSVNELQCLNFIFFSLERPLYLS